MSVSPPGVALSRCCRDIFSALGVCWVLLLVPTLHDLIEPSNDSRRAGLLTDEDVEA